ncbi:MAG: hypothetical protein ABIW19_13790 [Vicinamibacterales bacterium]
MTSMPHGFRTLARARASRIVLGCVLLLLVPASAPTSGQTTAVSLTREQMRDFLATAKMLKGKQTPRGVTRPSRVTLSDGTLTHDAAFSSVDERRSIERFANGKLELDFVDSYKYTLAAYGVAELVGLDHMMPVHVEREWRGDKGALSWWIDTVMDEGDRLKQKVQPPRPAEWNQQMYRMRVFAQLVADSDRNLGNVLIDAEWKAWMIDFTRSFRRSKTILAPGDLTKCDRGLLAKIRALTAEQVAAATKPYVGPAEVDALMARRDQIVGIFDKLIAEKGESHVLY